MKDFFRIGIKIAYIVIEENYERMGTYMTKMIKFILITTVLSAFVFGVTACGGGGSSSGGTPPPNGDEPVITEVSSLNGMADVNVASIFKMIFPSAVETSTVTNGSFFITPFIIATADVNADVSYKLAYDPAYCNAADAIAATVSCTSSTECLLEPESDLDIDSAYLLCLSSDISGFEGGMYLFTTLDCAAIFSGPCTYSGSGEPIPGDTMSYEDMENIIAELAAQGDLTADPAALVCLCQYFYGIGETTCFVREEIDAVKNICGEGGPSK